MKPVAGLACVLAVALGATVLPQAGVNARAGVDAGAHASAPTRVSGQKDFHAPLDRVLDTYVRGGLVYYRALKSERSTLDRYLAALDITPAQLAEWPADAQKAFWINAYNALVLRTVIDAYPIQGKSSAYPADSIRQVPGAFERRQHRVAGQALTLDDIEGRVLAAFGDARIVLALGRGAIGSGRLRSEAFAGDRLGEQLGEAVAECVQRKACFEIDRVARVVRVSPMIGWRTALFEKTYGGKPVGPWASRSPIERAVAVMVAPHLLPGERDAFTADGFTLQYGEMDWRLNDLTGR
jgi:hypothetical protein